MPNKIVTVPGVGNISFPGTMSDDDIGNALQAQYGTSTQMANQALKKTGITVSTGPSGPAIPQELQGPPTPATATSSATPSGPRPFYASQAQPESGIANRVVEFAKGLAAVPMALAHPVDLVSGMGSPMVASGMSPGGYPAFAPSTGNQARDEQNRAIQQQAANQAVSGAREMELYHPAYLAGNVAGTVALGKLGSRAASQFQEGYNITPYQSPQVQGAQLTQAINPPAAEYPSLGRNLAAQTGNIVDFAQRTKNPLKTNTDFAQAAQGAGYETQQYFNNKFIQPIADEQVSVAGSGYQGRTVGEGQRATVGDINDRIGQINDLMRNNYIKRRSGQVMQATAEDAALQAEHESLVNILHNTISDKLGVDPADVAALRQRAGQLYSIADQTQAAVNDRLSAFARQRYGQTLPESTTQAIFRIANRVRGGPEANASRALRTVLGAITPGPNQIAATPLPIPGPVEQPVEPPRSPAWLNAPQK